MKLQRVQFKNISQFSQLNIDFSSTQKETPITLLLGHQNSGKTSILKQIFNTLSWFSNRYKDGRSSGILITDVDILHDTPSAEVSIEISHASELGNVFADIQTTPRLDHTCRWKVQKNRQNNSALSISTSELTELEQLVNRYQKQIVLDPLFSTPCIAYYPVERFIYEVNIQGKNVVSTLAPMHNAYDLTVVNFTTFNKFFEWFREIHDVENAQAAKLFKQYLDPQQRFQNADDLDTTFASIEQAFRLSSQRCISSLRSTLKTVIPEVEDIELEYSPKLNLLVKHQGTFTPFLQLPQATRIWIGLVGDLVRRLCLLNPESLYPCLEGEGIILIDTIDLLLDSEHIQHILPRLQRAFPRLQFIVSSNNADLAQNIDRLECLQIIDQKIHRLNLHAHQKQLSQIYQDLSAPISETLDDDTTDQPSPNLEKLMNDFSLLSPEDQTLMLEQLQQRLSMKDS